MTKKIRIQFICLCMLMLLCLSSFAMAEANNPGYEFYFQQLDANQKAMYRAILEAPAKTAICTVVLPENGGSLSEVSGELHTVSSALPMDHPETMAWYFWHQDVSYDPESNTVTFSLITSNHYDPKDQATSEKLLDAIVAAADPDWDLYTKALFTSNVVIDALDYDWKYVFYPENGKADYYNSNIYCVNNGYAVCGGFSKLYKAIADRIGLPCVEVGSVGHAWVHVQMEDGNWYGVEPQNPLRLQGTSTMLNVEFLPGGYDMYGLYDEFFGEDSCIRQPERTVNDYVYTGSAVDPGSVDLTQARLDTGTDQITFAYTVNEDGKSCTITGFTGREAGDLTIPAEIDGYTVTVIGNSAFAYSNFDGKLTLPDTLVEIGNQAFTGCDRLTGQLILPANLRTLKSSAFMECKGLTGEIVFNDKLERIGRAAIAYCNGLTGSLMLPDSLVEMQDDSIYNCNNLDGVLHLPTGIADWSASYVSMCDNLSGFDVSADHPSYLVVDGILYSKDMTKVIQCMITKEGKVTIPEGVTTIGAQAFYRCEKITAISFPSTLKRIERWALGQTSGITEAFVLPDSLEYLEDYAFALSTGPTGTLTFRNKWQVGQSTFEGCDNLTTIIVEDGITELPPYTFGGSKGVRKVVLPKSLQDIGFYCFYNLQELEVYGYPGTAAEDFVTSENGISLQAEFHPLNGGYALSDTEIQLFLFETTHFEHKLDVLTAEAELSAQKVTWRSADESIATVKNGLVRGLAVGRTVITAEIGDTVLQCIVTVHEGAVISGATFSTDGRTLLKVSEDFSGKLIIPEGVEVIGPEAIDSVTGLTGITLPSTLKKLEYRALTALGYSHNLSLIFPDSVLTLKDIAVNNCCFASLRYPVNASVGEYALSMCTIGTLDIPEGVTTLPKNVFQYGNIDSCYLPASLTKAPYNAFENATVGTFYGYSGTYAEQYVAELQAYYPDKTFTFVSLGAPINHSQYTLIEGETVKLVWQENVTWASSDKRVATVDANGFVTGVKAGAATITATAANGTSASCRVTVKASGYGDANGDGVVDARDALVVLQYSAGWDVTLNIQNADVNEDGIIGLSDALQILMDCMGGDLVRAMRALQSMMADLGLSGIEITEHPVDQYATAGESVAFTVTASGDSLNYQWYIKRNDGTDWKTISGSTSSTYTIENISIADDGCRYYCVVTSANGMQLISKEAVLHVTPAVELPMTGDTATPLVWLMLMAVSLAGILLLTVYSRKRPTPNIK